MTGRMRIGSRIVVVGAIPVAIAAAIALAAILLLGQVEQARNGAAMAGTVYRTLLTAVTARNDFLNAAPEARPGHAARFFALTAEASDDLARLRAAAAARDPATANAQATLDKYVDDMRRLAGVTAGNDRLVAAMRERAATLVGLTDQARERQHASNADVVQSLTEGDAKLRAARDIVDTAYATRIAAAAVESDTMEPDASPDPAVANRRLTFDTARLAQLSAELVRRILARADDQSGAAREVEADLLPRLSGLTASFDPSGDFHPVGEDFVPVRDIARWSERMGKIYGAEYRSFHEQAAQLLTYSVQAHDTELATQNIAIETLKLGNRSVLALAARDEAAARKLLAASSTLKDTIAALPLSPLIQSEMTDALDRWREGLRTATAGMAEQNALLGDMDRASAAMVGAARSLDEAFGANAERTARSIRGILIVGAATGLLLGGSAAWWIARSITRPLRALQTRITQMAVEQHDGRIADDGRRDELGDIARATNVFLAEIARRERALRSAKERADTALATLRRTQAELIQSEKLASLGQLVAGVAHEINTPIGIALTTASVVEEETRRFRASMADGRVGRSALERMVERVSEGSQLLGTNLVRAADLIQSFKHVAADQVSGERRAFDLRTTLHQLLTSLGPMLRKAGHSARLDCPDEIVLDSAPGALAQVVTNLVVNASLHAFGPGEAGLVTVSVERAGPGAVRLTVADNGRGIAPENRARVFDPFFTTRRAEGSTGLGLGIVFNLVTATLGGRIALDEEPGCGTRFVVDLPCVAPIPRDAPARQEVSA